MNSILSAQYLNNFSSQTVACAESSNTKGCWSMACAFPANTKKRKRKKYPKKYSNAQQERNRNLGEEEKAFRIIKNPDRESAPTVEAIAFTHSEVAPL